MAKTKIQRKRKPSRVSNVFSQVLNSLIYIISNPMILVAIAVSLYLFLNPTLIQDFCKKFYNSALLKPIFEYIHDHAKQTAGFILAGTSCLTVLPHRYSFAGFIILGFVIYLCPVAAYLEYFCLTIFTILFIKTRNIRARIVVILFIILTLALGWWGVKLFGLGKAADFKNKQACEWRGFTWQVSSNSCI